MAVRQYGNLTAARLRHLLASPTIPACQSNNEVVA
jgi:hypothetical protein